MNINNPTSIFVGCVEDRDDPLKLGRCKVRIVGIHTENKTILATADLPWAYPMQPITSAGINGIGHTPVGAVPGTWVVVMFTDKDMQQPIMLGTIGGIPQSKISEQYVDTTNTIVTDGGVLKGSNGESILDSSGVPVTLDKGANIPADVLKGLLAPDLDSYVANVKSSANGIISSVVGAVGTAISNAAASLVGSSGSGGVSGPQLNLPVENANDISKPLIVPQVEKGTSAPIQAQATPAAADSQVLNAGIKTDPPAKYAPSDLGKAKQCISAIIDACDKLGYSSKYAKASILGICGGESKWLPVEEGHNYSAESLLKVFPGVFKSDPSKAETYARWKGSKSDFFKEIYSPKYGPGKALGNKQENDGALFYGRGFNQITGRPNYERIEKDLKKLGFIAPISTQPDLLTTDISISALCTVMFYKQRVSASHDSPNFFDAALKATGGFHGSFEIKRSCYEYFLGQGVLATSTNKSAADEQKTYDKQEVVGLPKNKQLALLEDRSANAQYGFNDPSGKYPLRNLLDEPDTNRLARGIIKETAIDFKDQVRTTGIPAANDNPSWEQPLAPFGGKYPYAKVYETESGHVQAFDDTPGHEYVSLYHRKGTFIDVDANGTQVNKIVGDGYLIIDRNGFIEIEGRCNITVRNSANVLVEGSADIQVNGPTIANFHNDVNIGCAKDVNWAIGGDFNLKVDGKFNTTVLGDVNESYGANHANQVTGNLTESITGNHANQVTGDTSLKIGGTSKTQIDGAITYKGGSTYKSQMSGEMSMLSSGEAKFTGKVTHIRATGGNINVDGTQFRGQQGAAVAATGVDGFDKFENFEALTLTAPEDKLMTPNKFDVLQTPVRPSPPVELKTDVLNSFNSEMDDYKKNPNKYYNPDAEAAGVNPQRSPQPDIGDAGQSMISGAESGDIVAFLDRQLNLAKNGHWSETGMGGKTSNANILAMWKDLGLGNVGTTDQVAWCAAFVNWTLKQCNYRYVQSARAYDFRDKPDRWKMTKVSDPQPGDVCVWSYSHVNFVYTVKDGKCTFVGGNQGGSKVTNNNPSGGSVTISYPNGVSSSHSNIVGFYRPSKA